MMNRDVQVGDVVGSVGRAFNGGVIDAVLHHHRGEGRACEDRLANHHVPPGAGHAIAADSNFDAVDVHWTVIATLDVLLARPD